MKAAKQSQRRLPRALALGMVAMLLLATGAYAGTAEPELAVVGGTGTPGSTVGVVIRLSNDVANQAVTADLDIEFPASAVAVETPVNMNCTVADRLATTHQVGGTVPRPGLLRFALFARALEIHPLGDGELATCEFHILPTAGLQSAPLTVVYVGLGDSDGALLPAVPVDGAIVVADATPLPTEPVPTATAPPSLCAGDCGGDARVTIDELIRGVNIALSIASLATCPALDGNGDGAVSIAELIVGVNNTLRGCSR